MVLLIHPSFLVELNSIVVDIDGGNIGEALPYGLPGSSISKSSETCHLQITSILTFFMPA